MERARLVTGFTLAPLACVIAWMASARWIAFLFGIFILLGAFEWAGLARVSKPLRAGFTGLVALVLASLWIVRPETWITLIKLAAAGWVLAPVLILWRRSPLASPWVLLCGLLVLVPTWCALVALTAPAGRPNSLLLAFLLLVWGVDTGAYVIGRHYGRHRLLPRVSPNKTWEGVLGGALAVCLVAWGMHFFLGVGWISGLLTCAGGWIFAIVGDLLESAFKRWSSLKDSGRLFPGHGGVLDRMDSWMAAAPVFFLCSQWLLR